MNIKEKNHTFYTFNKSFNQKQTNKQNNDQTFSLCSTKEKSLFKEEILLQMIWKRILIKLKKSKRNELKKRWNILFCYWWWRRFIHAEKEKQKMIHEENNLYSILKDFHWRRKDKINWDRYFECKHIQFVLLLIQIELLLDNLLLEHLKRYSMVKSLNVDPFKQIHQ